MTTQQPQKKRTEQMRARASQSGAKKKDLLLACLSYMTKALGDPRSAQSLIAGLAYGQAGMGPNLFCEAAQRAGLKAGIFNKKKIRQINASLMPCVIFTGEPPTPYVMLARDDALGMVTLYNPSVDGTYEMLIDDLEKTYAGYAIYVREKVAHRSIDEKNDSAIEKGNLKGKWFWSIVKQNRSIYGTVILASLFINMFALVSPLFIMNIYDRVIPNNAIETGWALGIGALAAFMFDFIFRNVRGYLLDFSGRKIDILAARKIYDHVLDMKLEHRPPSSGAFANILKDFDSVREFLTSATVTALVDIPFIALFLFFVYQLGGAIVLILVGVIAIVCTVGFAVQFALKFYAQKAQRSGQTRHAILVETIGMLETIKAGLADGCLRKQYSAVISEDAHHAQRSRFLSALALNASVFFQQTASIFLVLAGMYLVQSGDLTIGGLIASVILGGRAIAPIGQIANLITRYHQAGTALNALNRIMESPVERPSSIRFLHRPSLTGKLAFEKVTFSYPQAQIPVLDQVSFTIQQGERVGIIGRMGSGKSTIARLLLKLYEPDGGIIMADDTDYRQIDPSDLRRHMGYISQETQLFQGSVRDNITAFNPRAGEEEILECARITGVDSFVSRHPLGYDAPVGEMGAKLSGGQRQAIALTRAMITKPQILICDEPTSSMDTQSE
ncbi:MAG: type I secretion system permease/ATPase, partial [Alphaproteobacteria bacterium]